MEETSPLVDYYPGRDVDVLVVDGAGEINEVFCRLMLALAGS